MNTKIENKILYLFVKTKAVLPTSRWDKGNFEKNFLINHHSTNEIDNAFTALVEKGYLVEENGRNFSILTLVVTTIITVVITSYFRN